MNQENKQNDNIEYEFKILYAFSIFFIVMGHGGGGAISFFNELFPFYSFAISPFLFTSGYFYKEKYELNIKEFLIKKFKKLIVPLYLWNFFYGFLTCIIQNFGFYTQNTVNIKTLLISPLYDGTQFSLYLCSWFIFPLFITYVINIIARKISSRYNFRDKEYIFAICALLIGCFGMILSNNKLNTGFLCLLIKTCLFIPFFEFGILYRKYKNKKIFSLDNLSYFSIIFISVLVILYTNNGIMPWIEPGEANLSVASTFVLMPYITGMLGTAFWLRISQILSPSIGKSKYINILANNTYPIMLHNIFGLRLSYIFYIILHTYTNLCPNFNMYEFKTNIWYTYSINDIPQFLILNVIFAIVFSILIQKAAIKLKDFFFINIKNFWERSF